MREKGLLPLFYHSVVEQELYLQLTRVDNGRLLGVLDAARLGANGLKSLDDLHAGIVGDLAEDDVAAVEPRGGDGGHEELRAVAARRTMSVSTCIQGQGDSGIKKAYVLGPALAMDSRPGRVCFLVKFSSANFSP